MTDQRSPDRLYWVTGGVMGLLVAILLRRTFPTASLATTAGLLACLGGIGALVGWLLLRLQRPPASAAPVAPVEPHPDTERLFTLQSGVFSDDQLRSVRVRPVTMPMTPPDASIPMQVARVDAQAFVEVPPASSLRALVDAVLAVAQSEAMSVLGSAPTLELVSYYGNGPLDADGSSLHGWTFSSVDARLGLACAAVVLRGHASLRYSTATTVGMPAAGSIPDPSVVLGWAAAAPEAWLSQPKRLRVHLPDDVLLYAGDPICIADLDPREGRLLNASHLAEAARGEHNALPLEPVRAWLRGEPVSDAAVAELVADAQFADGLRTLAASSLAPLAARLGGAIPEQAALEIDALLDGDPPDAEELLHVLAYVPSSVALWALHRRASRWATAAALLRARAHGDVAVASHPLDSLSFLDVRGCLGRGNVEVVPLRSTFDAEADLLPTIEAAGFRLRRRRVLAGDSRTFAGAQLRASDHQTELLITSTPLPVPCHIAHVMGPRAATFAAELRRSAVVYAEPAIMADVLSGARHRMHRAALYVAALRIDDPAVGAALAAAVRRGGHDAAFRRALFAALGAQTSDVAREALREGAAAATEAERAWIGEVRPG